MITLTAKINLISNENANLSIGSNSSIRNNISKSINNIVSSKKQVKNPFILGSSILGEGATFEDSVDYFIDNALSLEEGGFVRDLGGRNAIFDDFLFVLYGNVNSLTIAFDTANNRHPKSIFIDNVEYVDDDAIFTVANLENSETHTIRFNTWNIPNSPIVISGIYVNLSIDIDYRNLISLNRSIFDRSDTKFPSFGIISNTGNIEFNDIDGEVKDYAEQLLLTNNLRVEVILKNTLANVQENVGIFETRDWAYDNNNRKVSVSLKDDLEEWQDIYVEGFGYDPRSPYKVLTNGTMSDLYNWLFERTPTKYNMIDFNDLDEKTKNILNITKPRYCLLENGTLWEQWTKLCEVCALYIYKNNEGKTICTYTYGS